MIFPLSGLRFPVITLNRVDLPDPFGPIIPVIKFKSDDELIQLANDTNYGLAAYFYTKKASRVWKIIENLEYGMLGINSGKISSYLNILTSL